MTTLYIDRQGSQLIASNGVLSILTPSEDESHPSARKIPLKYVERIVLRADTQLGSRTLCAISDAGVALLAIGGRSGQTIAQMHGLPHADARRRWHQVLQLARPDTSAQFARSIVSAKIRRQITSLSTIASHRPDLRKAFFDAQERLQRAWQKLKSEGHDHDLPALRGIEGAAAAHYFEAYFQAFAPALGAKDRNRRPPKDPVNATLSLAYTMLYSLASTACWTAGLDPALGALHTLSHGRAALACDLMEPHRAHVDLWVWEQFRSQNLRSEHFGQDGSGACLLGKAGRSHFYTAWQQGQAKQHERRLTVHARQIARALDKATDKATFMHIE